MGRPRGQTRGKVVAAALESLKQNGYAGSSTRAIAAIGGFNPALIFYYFESLDDLLVAALAESSIERLERYRAAVDDAGSLDELIAVLRRIYADDVASGHIRVVSEMVGASVSKRELAPRVLELMAPWLELAERGVLRASAATPVEGIVPAKGVARAAVVFYLGANLLTHLENGSSDIDVLFELAEDLAGTIGAWTSPPGTSAS
jgi:DNA-binding transcriptional regulator YbjK